jgi:hypothetical protein
MHDEEILYAIVNELTRLYGENYAKATVIQPGIGGWWYLGFPKEEFGKAYQPPVITTPVRKTLIHSYRLTTCLSSYTTL